MVSFLKFLERGLRYNRIYTVLRTLPTFLIILKTSHGRKLKEISSSSSIIDLKPYLLNQVQMRIQKNSFPYLFLKFQAEPKVFWNLMHNLSANLLYTTKSPFCLQSLIPCMVAGLSSKDKLKYQEALNRRVHFISTLIYGITREFGFSTARGCDLIKIVKINDYCIIFSLFKNPKQTLGFTEHLVNHCDYGYYSRLVELYKLAFIRAQMYARKIGKKLII